MVHGHPALSPLDVDLPERLSLRELDLSLTVQLQEREESNHHVDPVLAIRDEVSEPGLAESLEVFLDVTDGLGDGCANGRHVREIEGSRRPERGGGGPREDLGRSPDVVEAVLAEGAAKVRPVVEDTMKAVRTAMSLA